MGNEGIEFDEEVFFFLLEILYATDSTPQALIKSALDESRCEKAFHALFNNGLIDKWIKHVVGKGLAEERKTNDGHIFYVITRIGIGCLNKRRANRNAPALSYERRNGL